MGFLFSLCSPFLYVLWAHSEARKPDGAPPVLHHHHHHRQQQRSRGSISGSKKKKKKREMKKDGVGGRKKCRGLELLCTDDPASTAAAAVPHYKRLWGLLNHAIHRCVRLRAT